MTTNESDNLDKPQCEFNDGDALYELHKVVGYLLGKEYDLTSEPVWVCEKHHTDEIDSWLTNLAAMELCKQTGDRMEYGIVHWTVL